MKIDVAITNDNLKSEICKFINAINKFNIIIKQIGIIDYKTNKLTIIITDKKND